MVESLQNDAFARTKINENAVATNLSSLTVACHRVEPHSGSHRDSQRGVGLNVVRSEVGYEVMMSLVIRATYKLQSQISLHLLSLSSLSEVSCVCAYDDVSSLRL